MGWRPTALTQQNKATTQYANGPVPSMPGYGDPYDQPFCRMLTPQDQIHWLYVHLMRNPQTEDYSSLQEQIDELKERIDALEDAMHALEDRMDGVEELVGNLASGAYTYDVTAGDYAPAMVAARRTWQGANVWGMTCGELAQFTVNDIKEWECGSITSSGAYKYIQPGADLNGTESYEIGHSDARTYPEFNPADYIRRDELERIEVDNLQDGSIYGIPAGGLPKPDKPYMPYVRPATVGDLSTANITWNEHFVTDEIVSA